MAGDKFPVCDDLADAKDCDRFVPSTSIRSKGSSAVYDNGLEWCSIICDG